MNTGRLVLKKKTIFFCAAERSNYRGLKLTERCLKVIERVIEKVVCDIVEVSDMQFRFMPGKRNK